MYYTDYSEGTLTLAELFTEMGGDPEDSESCIKWSQWVNFGDLDDHFNDLSYKMKRYKFICVDTNEDDCLDFAELTVLVDVGLGRPGEALIEALALATDEELSDPNKNPDGYSSDARECAGHFLIADNCPTCNGDRVLQWKEAKNWFTAHVASVQTEINGEVTTLTTAGQHAKYFRKHFWPDALGDRYDPSQKGYVLTFDEFCAHWDQITLNEDSTIDLSPFKPPAPPAYVPPTEFLTHPPLLYSDFTLETMPTVLEVNKWYLNTLVPWYTWANTHPDGICKTFVEYSAGVTLPAADNIEEGNKYKGYVLDSDTSKPCGAGSFYCDGLDGRCRSRKQSGTGYFWNGKSYGPFYR